jgi:hypothetical protein
MAFPPIISTYKSFWKLCIMATDNYWNLSMCSEDWTRYSNIKRPANHVVITASESKPKRLLLCDWKHNLLHEFVNRMEQRPFWEADGLSSGQ